MNPTQDIPQGSAPATSEQPAGKTDSHRNAAQAAEETRSRPAAEGIPRDLTHLALGAGLLLAASLIFWIGLYLPNHVAFRAIVASFGTFALVWVLYRLRIFQRPHGALIATGAVALFAATLPFIDRGFQNLDRAAKAGLGTPQNKPADEYPEGLPVPTLARPSVPVPTPEKIAPPPEDDVIRELTPPVPDPAMGKLIRVTQDAKVQIGGRKFVIRAGGQFPFKKLADGTVTFLAGDQEVTIDSGMVAFTGQSRETPEEIARLAGEELRRRYPVLADKTSREREILDARITELKVEMPELFKNPRWPLEIGEQLAIQEGWKRAGSPAEDTAPPVQSPSGGKENPGPSDIPQEAPK